MAQDLNEVMRQLLQEVAALKLQLQQGHADTNGVASASSKKARAELKLAQDQWRRHILSFKFSPESHNIVDAFLQQSGLEVEDLGPDPDKNWPQAWYSPTWKVSYPTLRDFLALCNIDESSKASLTLDSFGWDSLSHKRAYFRSFTRPKKHAELWELLSARLTDADIGDATDAASDRKTVEMLKRLVPSRTIQITDLSPLLSSIILASVPKFNQTTVASFFDRYLSGANLGKALLQSWSSRLSTQHAYVFEYHVSFFYVPDVLIHPDLPTHDFRSLLRPDGKETKLRRGNPFTFNPIEPSRWIYEEQRSFLIVGCGPYIQTSIQLAENYFTGPFVRSYGRRLFPALESQPRPSRMFLNWLQYTMHLVNGRWQQAIEAVNSRIHTASDIIFIGDHLDLLSDDPRFSRSKTYFWALQAYKMFDEKLSQTIDAWDEFKENRLVWVNDGQFEGGEWDQSVAQIQKSVDALEVKRQLIRSKSEEVRHLREGLFGAASLFDSRTAVRQGDNIRLLTWITILFLPLTFCTSIFGMQVVLPPLPLHVFIITMPTVFAATAAILFNATNLIGQTEQFAQRVALHLRMRMKEHHHHGWKAQLEALMQDKQNFDTPVRRVERHSSHWTYVIFCGALMAFDIPVHEITWFLNCLWALKFYIDTRLLHRSSETVQADPEASPSPINPRPASSSPRSQTKKLDVRHTQSAPGKGTRPGDRPALRRSRTILSVYPTGFSLTAEESRKFLIEASTSCAWVIITAVRILLQCIWLPLILVEYLFLLPLIALNPFSWFSKGSGNLHGSLIKQPLQWLGFWVVQTFEPEIDHRPSSFKQAVITYQNAQRLWEKSDGATGRQHWRRLRQRRIMPGTERFKAANGNTASPPTGQAIRPSEFRRMRSSSAMGRIVNYKRSAVGDQRSSSQGPDPHERGRSRLGNDLVHSAADVPIINTPAPPRPRFGRSISRGRERDPDRPIREDVWYHETGTSRSPVTAQYLLSGTSTSRSRQRRTDDVNSSGNMRVELSDSNTLTITTMSSRPRERSRSRQRDEFSDSQRTPPVADEAASDYHTPGLLNPQSQRARSEDNEEEDVQVVERPAEEAHHTSPRSSIGSAIRHLRSRSTSQAQRDEHDIKIKVTHAD